MQPTVACATPPAEHRHSSDWNARRITASEDLGSSEEMRRLVLVGRYVCGLTHDLRIFNRTVLPLLQALQRSVTEDRPQDSLTYLDLLQERAESVSFIAEQVLDLGAGMNRLRVLADCISSTQKFVRPNMQRVEFVVDNQSPYQRITINSVQIQQVLVNLIRNAEQALTQYGCQTDQKPRITLTVHQLNRRTDREIIDALEGVEYVGISVTDNGMGMSEEVLARLATPFFTTRGGGDGTGLGMFMSAYLTKLHGGALVVHTRELEGTMVTVYLPVSS
jgi:two-component system, cell cycle sensor histidine kinase and response regulator CckA